MAFDERIFVGLGANLGDARATVTDAIANLARLPGTTLVATSSLYLSAPVDAAGADYVNAVVELRSELEPLLLLAHLQEVEQCFGRERPYRHAPRTLDLDLLSYGLRRIDAPTLTLPHPRMHLRAFVLAPLAELVPEMTLADGKTVAQALHTLRDQRIRRLAR